MKSFHDFKPPRTAANYRAHGQAAMFPEAGHEKAVRDLCLALEAYVNASVLISGDAVDGVLSDGLGGIVEGIRVLLNGDIGRFDGGTISSFLDYIANEIGWCSDHDRMFYDCDEMTCSLAANWQAERRAQDI